MKMTFGAFKQVHDGFGIYWAGSYNVEGDGSYTTIHEAKVAIDQRNLSRKAREDAETIAKIATGNYIVARKLGDEVSVSTPAGPITFGTMRAFRQQVFELEERFGMDLIWA